MHWKHLLVDLREHVADVIPRVAVQALLQPLLVEEVADEAHAAAQDEEPVKGTSWDDIFSFVFAEEATEIKID